MQRLTLTTRIDRRGALRLLGMSGLGWLVAACGGGKQSSPTADATSAETSTTGSAPTATRTAVTPTPPTPSPTPASRTAARVDKDIDYGEGLPLTKLDIHYSTANLKPAPLVMLIHGGAFQGGDKADDDALTELPELLSRGYTVASINYRLGSTATFPNPVVDAKAALRFLRANAAKYGVNPDRVGVWGWSVGGYLANMLGVTTQADGFDTGPNAAMSSRVQAVVDKSGLAEFTARTGTLKLGDFLTSTDADLLKKASPVTYITRDDPPFLIVHGDMDAVVPIAQSQEMLQRLKAAGVSAQMVTVRNGAHIYVAPGSDVSPSATEIARTIGDFFDQQLRA